MTVKELIEILKEYPEDMRVVSYDRTEDYSDITRESIIVADYKDLVHESNDYKFVTIPNVLHL